MVDNEAASSGGVGERSGSGGASAAVLGGLCAHAGGACGRWGPGGGGPVSKGNGFALERFGAEIVETEVSNCLLARRNGSGAGGRSKLAWRIAQKSPDTPPPPPPVPSPAGAAPATPEVIWRAQPSNGATRICGTSSQTCTGFARNRGRSGRSLLPSAGRKASCRRSSWPRSPARPFAAFAAWSRSATQKRCRRHGRRLKRGCERASGKSYVFADCCGALLGQVHARRSSVRVVIINARSCARFVSCVSCSKFIVASSLRS